MTYRTISDDADATEVPHATQNLLVRVELAKRYLRSRGKYVLDQDCTFKPTPSTDRFNIIERYGRAA